MSLYSGWNLVLLLATLLSAAALAIQVAHRIRPDLGARRLHWTPPLLWGATGMAVLAFLYLVLRFIVADLSYEYVFLYTRVDLPLRYRIAGAWTGREGSLLLWTLFLGVVTSVLAWWYRRSAPGKRSGAGDGGPPGTTTSGTDRQGTDAALASARAWTLLWLSGILTAFLLATWLQDTFAATPQFFLNGRPEGNGLNPTLLSPFMLIHPPLMFVAYALAAVPAAAALGHLVSGHGLWSRVAFTPSRADWLLYSFAMGLGGLWAYYTLGFGGYWAWDPVEVANFLPWLALTIYLHAQRHHLRHGSYTIIGPFLALLPWLLTIFSTLSTRSGLWVSVHAFTDPNQAFNPDAPGRFLDILQAEPSLRFFVSVFMATLLLGLALWSRRLSTDLGTLERTSRIVAALLAAAAAYAVVAPQSLMSLLFEAGHLVSGGNTPFGLLGLIVAACLAAAAPVFFAPEPDQGPERRGLEAINIRSLVYTSVTLLGLSLVLLFLFHMSAANGWSRAFYDARVPWIATPIALALIVMLTYKDMGRRNGLLLAGGALLAGLGAYLVAERGLGAYSVTLSTAVLLAAIYKLHQVHGRGAPDPHRLAGLLLWLGAVLSLLFWVNPPSRIGVPGLWVHWTWPIQLILGGASMYALWGATRIWVGMPPRRPYHVHLLVGLLGAYYIAPLLAVAAFLLHRRPAQRTGGSVAPPLQAKPLVWRRLRAPAVYGIHFLVALVFIGYSLSTYYADTERGELPVLGLEEGGMDFQVGIAEDDDLDLGPYRLAVLSIKSDVEPGTPWLQEIHPRVAVLESGDDAGVLRGTVDGILYWEPQTGSHYPLPSTLRLWSGDVYLSVSGVCTDPTGACEDAGDWVRVFEPTTRLTTMDGFSQVRVEAHQLPAVGTLWFALVTFPAYMAMLMRADAHKNRAQPIQ